MTTVRFSGETPWEAIVNHKSLDIVGETALHIYSVRRGYDEPRNLPLETLEVLYAEWQVVVGKHFGYRD